jgi:hypothetical protein
MSDSGSLIPISDEQARAIQEALKTLQGFGGFLRETFGTVPEDLVGVLGGDWLKVPPPREPRSHFRESPRATQSARGGAHRARQSLDCAADHSCRGRREQRRAARPLGSAPRGRRRPQPSQIISLSVYRGRKEDGSSRCPRTGVSASPPEFDDRRASAQSSCTATECRTGRSRHLREQPAEARAYRPDKSAQCSGGSLRAGVPARRRELGDQQQRKKARICTSREQQVITRKPPAHRREGQKCLPFFSCVPSRAKPCRD